MIRKLFPTQIFTHKLLRSSSRLFSDLKVESYQIRDFDRPGVAWSKKNYPAGFTSYSSRNDLFYMSSTFRELEEKIHPHVLTYAKALGYETRGIVFSISDMWVNIMGPGCVHTGHIHPLSCISGTYYVSVPKGASAIRFEDPRLGFQMACPPRRPKLPEALQSFVSHQPQAGELVLFESWLRHEVPPHTAREERVSVSFNYGWSYVESDGEREES